MIVIDTSVWIDHLREADPTLIALLGDGRQRVHPFVIGELALGSLRDRTTVLTLLERMPSAPIAEPDDVIHLITEQALHGLGIGYVDAHLLASAKLMPGSRIWTRDKRLAAVSERLGLSYHAPHLGRGRRGFASTARAERADEGIGRAEAAIRFGGRTAETVPGRAARMGGIVGRHVDPGAVPVA